MIFKRLSLLVGTAASLSACGSSAVNSSQSTGDRATATATSGGSACGLLTMAEAERALAHPVKKLDATGGAAGLDICQYGYEGEHVSETGNVSVTLHGQPLNAMRQGVERAGYHAEPVPDLSDAFWSPETGLYVGKGSRTALIFLAAGGMTDAKARAVALGRTIQSKM